MVDPGQRAQSSRSYARALERALTELHGQAIVFTHRDWDLASRWHDRGIPLGVVLDALESKRKRPPRGLGAVASAVEESWQVVLAGRIAEHGAVETSATRDAVDPARQQRDSMARLPAGSPIRALLERAALSPEDADRVIDDHLIAAADSETLAACERAVDDRLAAYRARMPRERFEATRKRAMIEALRRRYGIPRHGATT